MIGNLFKLYPWEFMLREMFSTKLEDAGVRWLEPAWKSIISNKALLPMLWEMFPNHPNLLAAYFSEDAHPEMEKYVIKPIFSREGANVSIVENGKVVEAVEGPYGEEGTIVQAFYPLPKFGDSYTLIGSWLINDQPAGIGIREDRALITRGSVALLSAHFRRIMPRSGDGKCRRSALSSGANQHRQHAQRAHLDAIDRDRHRLNAIPRPRGHTAAAGNAPPSDWRASPLRVPG